MTRYSKNFASSMLLLVALVYVESSGAFVDPLHHGLNTSGAAFGGGGSAVDAPFDGKPRSRRQRLDLWITCEYKLGKCRNQQSKTSRTIHSLRSEKSDYKWRSTQNENTIAQLREEIGQLKRRDKNVYNQSDSQTNRKTKSTSPIYKKQIRGLYQQLDNAKRKYEETIKRLETENKNLKDENHALSDMNVELVNSNDMCSQMYDKFRHLAKVVCKCPEEWKQHKDKCYRYMADLKNWHESRDECLKMSADLVIEDWHNQKFLVRSIYRAGQQWIGYRQTDAVSWHWVDRTRTNPQHTATRWLHGQPPGGATGQCALVVNTTADSFHWVSAACGRRDAQTAHAVCQKDVHCFAILNMTQLQVPASFFTTNQRINGEL